MVTQIRSNTVAFDSINILVQPEHPIPIPASSYITVGNSSCNIFDFI